jgi:hypothetical protein
MDTRQTSNQSSADTLPEGVSQDETTIRNRILMVGRMPATLDALRATTGKDWISVSDIQEAHAWLLSDEVSVRQVWLCATQPGQFKQDDVNFMLEHWPLLSIVYVAGDWCQGELRSGWPVQGIPRRLLAEVVEEISGEIRTVCQPEVLGGARTAQAFEQWLEAEKCSRASRPVSILVVTEWRETWEALRDCLKLGGHTLHWWQPGHALPTSPQGEEEPSTLVVDFSRGVTGAEVACVEELKASSFRRRVAVIGFPRPQDVDALKGMGFDEVVFKPLRMDILLKAINGVEPKVDS